jgi:two-component system sensor histidine kinase RegB
MSILGGLAVVILGALWMWARPLPWEDGLPPDFPMMYRVGVATSLGLAIGFLGIYLWLVSAEARDRARALVATEAALTREAKMSALGSLAAAAAHELGGPLGTITLIAHSLSEALGDDPDFGEDIRLLASEAARSRGILVRIARRAEAEDPFATLGLDVLLHEVARNAEPARVPLRIITDAGVPKVKRSPELLHGLANLVANAVRHAGSTVELHASANSADVQITVLDDGPGFPEELLPRFGDPDLGPSKSGSGGTGLGIFIATTLLERTGGRLAFSNPRDGGAQVDVRWPRPHIEAREED